MPTVYLYIPFSESEDPTELIGMAKRWETLYRSKQELREILAEDSPTPYIGNEIKVVFQGSKGLADMKEHDKVYILSHGMEGTPDVCNQARGGGSTLDQKTIAQRLIADGLPEKTNLKINLYYCDESNEADNRTAEFDLALHDPSNQKDYSNVTLSYYPGVILSGLSVPIGKEGQDDKAYKRALRKLQLGEMKPDQLNEQFKVLLDQLSAKELQEYLKSLSAETLLKILSKLDIKLIQAIQTKANIGDQNTFFLNLRKDKTFEPVIMEEVGRAKHSKREYKHPKQENVHLETKVKVTKENKRPEKILLSGKSKNIHDKTPKQIGIVTKDAINDSKENQEQNPKTIKPKFNDT